MKEKTMKLYVSIQSSDPSVGKGITKANIADGITIKQNLILRESISPTFYSDLIFIIQNIALPVAATLIANFLYDKLERKKDNSLSINNRPVEINAKQIEQLIINIEKEKKDE